MEGCLNKAANLSGWPTQNCGSESAIVDGIVDCIWKELQKMRPSPLTGLEEIGPRIEQLQTLLCRESSNNVFILGLWGMGGIGNTTGASPLFDRIQCQFERCIFLENVRNEALPPCTEGLGFESSHDARDLKTKTNTEWRRQDKKVSIEMHSTLDYTRRESRKTRPGGGAFLPPPISCIGKSGRPSVSFESYRHDGRFVLEEIRIPNQKNLHACREHGRLKLQFIQPNEEAEYEEGKEENFTEDYEQEKKGEAANSNFSIVKML